MTDIAANLKPSALILAGVGPAQVQGAVHVFGDLPTLSSTTGVCFSPDERLILTGVSAGRDGSGGGAVISIGNAKSWRAGLACLPA